MPFLPAGLVAAAVLAADPGSRPAQLLTLLDAELSLRQEARPDLRLALVDGPSQEPDPSLDFDLLGKPQQPPPKVDDAALARRRSMLKLHQGLGLGLLGLQLATTVVGQLNYSDKFASNAPDTGRYQLTHKVLAYSTLSMFAVTGALALLAPSAPPGRSEGFDRVTLHKIGMAVAAAGMIAEGVLGFYTAQREGYLNQASYAQAHLVIGYATLAAVAVAVGALVF